MPRMGWYEPRPTGKGRQESGTKSGEAGRGESPRPRTSISCGWWCGDQPLIWRRLLVPADITIADPHAVLQVAFGRYGEHLHRFVIHGTEYGIAYVGGPGFRNEHHPSRRAWATGARAVRRRVVVPNLPMCSRRSFAGSAAQPARSHSCAPTTTGYHIMLADPATGEPVRFTPHDFRRLFITDAVLNWLPQHIAQVITGHRDINVTLGYKAVYPDEAVQAHLAFLARRRALRPTDEYRGSGTSEQRLAVKTILIGCHAVERVGVVSARSKVVVHASGVSDR